MEGTTLPVVAPASVYWLTNEFYGSDEEFVFAVADALHEEYGDDRYRASALLRRAVRERRGLRDGAVV